MLEFNLKFDYYNRLLKFDFHFFFLIGKNKFNKVGKRYYEY